MERELTRLEWVILCEFYFNRPPAHRDDSHPACQMIAKFIDRTPGAVDAQLRALKFYVTKGAAGHEHGSTIMREVADRYYKPQRPSLVSSPGLF